MKRMKRMNITILENDYEYLRNIAFRDRTSMSFELKYMIHYFRDNLLYKGKIVEKEDK